jgi:hypothetical protein
VDAHKYPLLPLFLLLAKDVKMNTDNFNFGDENNLPEQLLNLDSYIVDDTISDLDSLEDHTHPSDVVRQAFDFFQFNQRVLNKDVRKMEVDLDRRSARELVSLYYD